MSLDYFLFAEYYFFDFSVDTSLNKLFNDEEMEVIYVELHNLGYHISKEEFQECKTFADLEKALVNSGT